MVRGRLVEGLKRFFGRVASLGLLFLLLTSPLRAQAPPGVPSLERLIEELVDTKPPLDPADLASIVADTNAVLSSLSGSTVPYEGVPESLAGARLGMRVANLLYHRFGQPQEASAVLAKVRTVYGAYPPGAPIMVAALGNAQSVTASLPTSFTPSGSAATTNACAQVTPDLPFIHSETLLQMSSEGTYGAIGPQTDISEMSVRCELEPSLFEGVRYVVSIPPKPAVPPLSLIRYSFVRFSVTSHKVRQYAP
jgi:hypothetical protein